MKKEVYFPSLIFISVLSLFLFFQFRLNKLNVFTKEEFSYDTKTVVLGTKSIDVLVADTSQKQRLGLGERKNLDENLGMYFPYSQKAYPYFWMKGMLFPIDIVWIADDKIVKIDANVPNEPGVADNHLRTYSPPIPINAVVEFNAGFCAKNGIEVGDSFSLGD